MAWRRDAPRVRLAASRIHSRTLTVRSRLAAMLLLCGTPPIALANFRHHAIGRHRKGMIGITFSSASA
jgi:hypothetical protein